MTKFANNNYSWLNRIMKSTENSIKNKIISKYLENKEVTVKSKSTDINVLLNRVKVNQKSESRKKIYFSAIVSTGLLLFGVMIF
jgi:hypothetical protein